MERNAGWIEKYLSNNFHFNKNDALYRKVFLLNTILAIMIVQCVFFLAVDIIFYKAYVIVFLCGICAVLSFFTLIFFKKTNNYVIASNITTLFVILFLIVYFHLSQNQLYAFCWIAVVPPVLYALFDEKKATIVFIIFSCYILYFFFSHKIDWVPAEFNSGSIFNIAGAILCVVLLVAYYEKSVEYVWAELQKTFTKLIQSENKLRLIFDSSAEGILGIDLNDKIMFCNKSCINMLGYSDQNELLDQNMHTLILHTKHDATPLHVEDSKILQGLKKNEFTYVEDEIFWRADGTWFNAEYYSYPQEKDGVIIGFVVTFMDITERKKREEEIHYLNCYDPLTGLHNRKCFEDNLSKFDTAANLPISMIFADINGLKLTNDIFGHTVGDELIKKTAEILTNVCRKNDVAARVGGDEFIIMLPKTDEKAADIIVSRIKEAFEKTRIREIKCSVSLGYDTRINLNESIEEVKINAENAMYKDKSSNRKSVNASLISTICDTLFSKLPTEKHHAISVHNICTDFGAFLNLSGPDANKLCRAGYLHDIGKIVVDEKILLKSELSEEDHEKMEQHPVIGYRILNLFDETLDLAEYVYGHHERWDGLGYPRGLEGENIPLLSRIISVVETYDRVLNRGEIPFKQRKLNALKVIECGAGKQFDPQIARSFIEMINKWSSFI